MPPRHKTAWLIGLGAILAAWLYLQYRVMLADEDRYARQRLRVAQVEVSAAPDAPPLDDATRDALRAQVEAALTPQLLALSACLATPTGTRAPATLALSLGGDAPLAPHWLTADALPADTTACLARALPTDWPAPSAPTRAQALLAPSAEP
jgi:hypothetical protein